MTLIIGIKNENSIRMFCDGRTTAGSKIIKENDEKIKKYGDILIGTSGDCRLMGIIEDIVLEGYFSRKIIDKKNLREFYYELVDKCKKLGINWKTDDGDNYIDGEIIIGSINGLFNIDAFGIVDEIEHISGIGSGYEYCKGIIEYKKEEGEIATSEIRRIFNIVSRLDTKSNNNMKEYFILL